MLLLASDARHRAHALRAPSLPATQVLGVGLAYAGTAKEEVLAMLMPILADLDQPLDVVAIAALSLGLTHTGTCNHDICQEAVGALMERAATKKDEEKLAKDSLARLLCVGVGLLYLGRQTQVEIALELAKPTLPLTLNLSLPRTLNLNAGGDGARARKGGARRRRRASRAHARDVT